MSTTREKSLRRSFASYRLPPGRHGIPAAQVAENQRWRLLGATAEVLAERGYVRTRSAGIARRAGVSSVTFYQHFDNVDSCLLAAFEMSANCICDLVSEACEKEKAQDWQLRLRAALYAVLVFLASEPALANLLGVPAPDIVPARDRLLGSLAGPLREARRLRPETAPALAADTERRLIAGAIRLVSDRVGAGEAEHLPELAQQLAAILAAPYLGAVA